MGRTYHNTGVEEQIRFVSYRAGKRRSCCKGGEKHGWKKMRFLFSGWSRLEQGKACMLDLLLDDRSGTAAYRSWRGCEGRTITGGGMLQRV